jgi:hypothetical protein
LTTSRSAGLAAAWLLAGCAAGPAPEEAPWWIGVGPFVAGVELDTAASADGAGGASIEFGRLVLGGPTPLSLEGAYLASQNEVDGEDVRFDRVLAGVRLALPAVLGGRPHVRTGWVGYGFDPDDGLDAGSGWYGGVGLELGPLPDLPLWIVPFGLFTRAPLGPDVEEIVAGVALVWRF